MRAHIIMHKETVQAITSHLQEGSFISGEARLEVTIFLSLSLSLPSVSVSIYIHLT